MIRRARPAPAQQRSGTYRGATIPSPTGGWNARDPLDAMPPEDAITLDNWFPETSNCRIRRGFTSWATGVGGGSVETLMEYASPTTSKLLGCANGSIYDATAGGAVGAALATGFGNNRWQHTNFSTPGGAYAIFVNGADTPQKYDGSAVSATVITGASLTATNLIGVNVFKNRLFFTEKSSLRAWYLPVQTIAGTAVLLDLSSQCRLGGYLMAVASWTRSGGLLGSDDLCCFITSEGEVLIFQGTDPGSASTWSIIGVFRTGRPLGRRCFIKVGPELVILTQDGAVPLSRILPADQVDIEKIAITSKIERAFTDAARSYFSNFGWQMALYPRAHMMLVNIPVSELTTAHQYVVNTTTGAWCRFLGMNANCWAVSGGLLYFGGAGGIVYLADTGVSDNSANILAELKTSFQYHGGRGSQKLFSLLRPIIQADSSIGPAVAINVDFADTAPTSIPTTIGFSGGTWDVSLWDSGLWADDTQIIKNFTAVQGIGYCAAARVSISTKTATVQLNAIDLSYQMGGLM